MMDDHFAPVPFSLREMATNHCKLLLLFIVAGQLFCCSSTEATDGWPPKSRAHRFFWDKDDEHTNKTVPIQRRHVTSTLATTTVTENNVTMLDRTAIFHDAPTVHRTSRHSTGYPHPPGDWYSTRSPVNRELERLQSSSLWGSRPQSNVKTGPLPQKSLGENHRQPHHHHSSRYDQSSPASCAVPYRFGLKCDGICHCSTVSACDKMTGHCKTGICAHGFMDPPACQRPCPSGQFGFRCGFYCHCWKGTVCDSVNGFCAPDGKCAEEWFGPSCQVRKLELSDAPFVTVTDCENITVSWRQWTNELDFGNPEIVVRNYELEVRTPSRPQWRTIYRILSDDETIKSISKKQPLAFHYTPAPDTRFYQFRVVVNGLDSNGKYVTGVPSIPTEVFQRNCPTENGASPITDIHTLPTFVPVTGTRATLPSPVTAYPTFPIQSVETVPNPTSASSTLTSSTTAITSTTPSTTVTTTALITTTAQIAVNDFQLTNDQNNPGNVLVSWNLAPGSPGLPQDAGLLVEMIGIGDCDPFQTTEGPQIFKLSNTSVQTLRLERWRQYRITLLRSIAASDVASASLARKVIITTGKTPSAAVENMQLEEVASRAAKLSWSELPCEDRGDTNITYEVNLFRTPRLSPRAADNINGTRAPFQTINTNRTYVSLIQLSPAFEYLVKVIAKNRYGSGPPAHIHFTTPPEEQPRPAPQFLPVTGLTPDQATLSWLISPASPGHVYPPVESCELKVTPADSVVPVLLERYPNCSQTNRTITGLHPNTRYLAELTQSTSEGQPSYTTMVIAIPEAAPGPSLNIAHRVYNKTCIEVDWDPPNPANGVITNYSLYLSVLDSYLPLRRQSVDRYIQKDPGRVLCNMMLSTRYSFSVQAATNAGFGPMAEITFWTPLAEPDPPPVPFARLSDEDTNPTQDTANIVVLAQPVRFSTGVIQAYFLKLATMQQLKEYEAIYGVSTNGTSLYVTPDTKAEAALAALPGRLVHRVLPDRFEQQQNGPLLHQALLEVPNGQFYRVVWAISVQLEDDSRLAASVSEVVRVPGTPKQTSLDIIERTTTRPSPTAPILVTTAVLPPTNEKTIYNNTIFETKSDERVGWVFGIVIALIILLVIIAIIIILICCCWKRFDVPQEAAVDIKQQTWSPSEHVQTDDPPLHLEDWFNPTTQVDDSRYVVRGQRVLTPTRYSTTIITPR